MPNYSGVYYAIEKLGFAEFCRVAAIEANEKNPLEVGECGSSSKETAAPISGRTIPAKAA